MTLALDGSVAGSATASSLAVSLTTTQAGMIVVAVTCNGGPVTSITASGLTFTRRSRNGNFATNIEEWAATSAAAVSSKSITVNQTSSAFLSVCAFGVSGNPNDFDPNVALPSVIGDGSGNSTSSRATITTSHTDGFLIGMYRFRTTANPTQFGAWTKISGANFMLVEYLVVAAAQSGTIATIAAGDSDQNGGIGDSLTTALRKHYNAVRSARRR